MTSRGTTYLQYENVLLFLSDATPYIVIKAGTVQITIRYSKMLHLTYCVSHRFHRVSETVIVLIAAVKSVPKCRNSRMVKCKKLYANLCLLQDSTITWWGTCSAAVEYTILTISQKIKDVIFNLGLDTLHYSNNYYKNYWHYSK